MTANEKRVRFAIDHHVRIHLFEKEVAAIVALVDAAERRGEERVLRWMRARGWDGAIVDYKQARRARVGRGQ